MRFGVRHKKDAFLWQMPRRRRVFVIRRRPSSRSEFLNDEPTVRAATNELRALSRSLARFREPNSARSIVEILITIVPFVLLWLSMWLAYHLGYGLYLLLAIPTAGFLVRLFMIQHDCGHGSFFRHRSAK